jgi:hypothetical protein
MDERDHKAMNEELNQPSCLGAGSGSSLSEAILIMENLMAYGRIHTVKGVRYVEGSHGEILDKAEEWLNKVRKNYR